ncbi:MAG: HAMP domain-containing histidine kinase [Deltaproteobacteria bacterium]|nr:HAMP domain-containing histidine kinase [Deltaproteobacteria bacterium]
MSANPDRMQLLSSALSAAATRAAELVGGGAALLFAVLPGEAPDGPPRLRAAAGFASHDDAREAAAGLADAVSQCHSTGRREETPATAGMQGRAAAGIVLHPLAANGTCHGVLAIGLPIALPAETNESVTLLAATTAVHLDHSGLCEKLEQIRADKVESESFTDERSDELLKLSETLFAQDIELLRSNEKLGQIEKIKSDFIEKMSRELRTPLNSIIEAIISVLAGENENISETAKQSLRTALDEGTIYQRTLQNILDLWRIRQGEMAVEVQDLNLSELIDEAIFSIQDTIAGKPIVVRKHIQEPFPKLKCDPAKLNQILFLLLDNAAKFTAEGDIEISARYEDGTLYCQISDTGIGICPDDQDYVFDEFFQVDDRASTQYRGAGLGLSLVTELLELLDGRCAIRSEAGQGTTASIEIAVQPS